MGRVAGQVTKTCLSDCARYEFELSVWRAAAIFVSRNKMTFYLAEDVPEVLCVRTVGTFLESQPERFTGAIDVSLVAFAGMDTTLQP